MRFRSALKFYNSLGKGLYRCRLFISLLVFLGAVFSVFLVFSSSELSAKYLLLALLFTTWLILLLSLAYFRADDLVQEQPHANWIAQLSHALRMAFGILLISAFTLVGLALLWMSISAITRVYS